MLRLSEKGRRGDHRKCSAEPLYPWKGSLGRQSGQKKEAHLDGEEVPNHDIPSPNPIDLNPIRTRPRTGDRNPLILALAYFHRAMGLFAWFAIRKTLTATLTHGRVRELGGRTI